MTAWDRILRGLRHSDPVPTTVDLTEEWELTSFLLREPGAWRVRAVERLTVGSARLCSRRRSLHVAPLAPILGEVGIKSEAPTARMLLPVELITKRPLLDFDVSADGHPAYLVPRGATSELEAGHVRELARREGVELDVTATALVTSICEFTPTTWKHYARRRPWLRRSSALVSYVSEGLGVSLSRRDIVALEASAGRVAAVLRAATDGVYRWWSSADEPLLAVVGFAERRGVHDLDEIVAALDALGELLEELAVESLPSASPALRTLAAYGVVWQSIVLADVPTDRPFVIATQRQEPIRLSWLRGQAQQALSLSDAATNHVTLGTSDESVELGRVRLVGPAGRVLGLVTGLRLSRERYAVYLAEPDRPWRGSLRFRLRVPRSILTVSLLIASVTWLAAAVTGWLLIEDRLAVDDLAVLAVPTTFAASLLLTRERNSLARRLQWRSRAAVWLGTAALWGMAAYAWSHDLLVVP